MSNTNFNDKIVCVAWFRFLKKNNLECFEFISNGIYHLISLDNLKPLVSDILKPEEVMA
jgi:hypothetical protein